MAIFKQCLGHPWPQRNVQNGQGLFLKRPLAFPYSTDYCKKVRVIFIFKQKYNSLLYMVLHMVHSVNGSKKHEIEAFNTYDIEFLALCHSVEERCFS